MASQVPAEVFDNSAQEDVEGLAVLQQRVGFCGLSWGICVVCAVRSCPEHFWLVSGSAGAGQGLALLVQLS